MTEDKTSKFFKGVLSLATSGVVSLLLGLGNFTLAARFIPPDAFGAFFILFTVVQLMENVSDMGLRLSAPKFLSGAATDAERGRIARTIYAAKLGITVVMLGLIVVLKPLILAVFEGDTLAPLYGYLPVLYLGLAGDMFLDAVMQGYHRYSQLAWIRSGGSICQFILVLIFLWPGKMGVEGYILAITLSYLASTAVRLIMLPGPRLPGLDWPFLKELVRFSYPLAGNNILSFAYRRLDLLIVGALMSPEMVALVGVARRIPETLERLYTSFFSVYFPHVSELASRQDPEETGHFVNRTARLIAGVTCLGTIFTILFSSEIQTLLFSKIYAQSALLMEFFMIAFAIAQVSSVMVYAILAMGRSTFIPLVSVMEAAVNIGANLSLIPLLSVVGTGMARVLSVGLANLFTLFFCKRYGLAAKGREYLPMIGIVCVFMAAKHLLPFSGLTTHVLLFALAAIGLLAISKKNLQDMRHFVRLIRDSRAARRQTANEG